MTFPKRLRKVLSFCFDAFSSTRTGISSGNFARKHYRGVMANIGERSGCVVTTPIGITGSLSTR